MLREKFEQIIADRDVFQRGDSLLLACSGGPDSMALAGLIAEIQEDYDLRVGLCIVNHQIREEAADEVKLVQAFAREKDWACYVKEVDVPKLAKKEKISLELAGRQARYAFFDEIVREHNYDAVLLAHHRDDQVETILSHILRGSGADGLCGMPYKRGLHRRPLLDMTKEELIQYVEEKDISYAWDSSNDSRDYERNRIRHDIVPLLEEFNPKIGDSLMRLSAVLRQENEYMEEEVKKLYHSVFLYEKNGHPVLHRIKLQKAPQALRARLWRYIARQYFPYGSTPSYKNIEDMDQVIFLEGNKQFFLKWMKISVQYDKIYIAQPSLGEEKEEIPISTSYIPLWREYSGFKKKTDKGTFLVPLHMAVQGIMIRTRQSGDRIILLNKKRQVIGHKPLKKYINDRKIPLEERAGILWLTVGQTVLCEASNAQSFTLYEEGETQYALGHFEEEMK